MTIIKRGITTLFLAAALVVAGQVGHGWGASQAGINSEVHGTNAADGRASVSPGAMLAGKAPAKESRAVPRLKSPDGVAVDPAHNEIVVTNIMNDTIVVYSRTADGAAAPLRTVIGRHSGGKKTGLDSPIGVAVDMARNEILVANNRVNSVTVYSRTARGDAVPMRAIKGPSTGLNGPVGIALVNDEIFVVSNRGASVTVYARTANGDVAPLRTIVGPATGLVRPWSIAADAANGALFVTDWEDNSVKVFNLTASGDAAPVRTIVGASTNLNAPSGIVYDGGEIFVANKYGDSITVFNGSDTADVAPKRTIAGANTRLSNPMGIAVDAQRNEIIVGNDLNSTVTVYSRTQSGDAAPLRVITGANAGMPVATAAR